MKVSILLASLFSLAISKTPIVHIPTQGRVQGSQSESSEGKPFYSFEGIPFAAAPIGNLRLREPQDPHPWQGILQADSPSQCLQLKGTSILGVEDCLHLNVYTPTLKKTSKLDVIVFIHGGGFVSGSGGQNRPDYILNKDVVYVSINFRLGVLGFATTGSQALPGNNGIKDQIKALKWIQKHIVNFGGNPDSVTISGGAAGSTSSLIHMLSPKSKGLFHKAILRSGIIFKWSEGHPEKTKELGLLLQCDIEDDKKLVGCLRNASGEQLVNSTQNLYTPFPYGEQHFFGIVVDTCYTDDPIFPQRPYTLMKTGKIANDVPIMYSYVSAEGLYPASDYYNDTLLQMIDSEWNKWIPYIFLYNEYVINNESQDEISQKIRQYYLGDQQLTKSTFKQFVDAAGDRYFYYLMHRTLQLLLPGLKSPIYFNYFDYEGADSMFREIPYEDRGGVGHYADISYVVQTTMESTNSTARDREVVDSMVEIFANFAKYGEPKIPGWVPVPENQEKFTVEGLVIDPSGNLTIGTKVLESWEFWKSFLFMDTEAKF